MALQGMFLVHIWGACGFLLARQWCIFAAAEIAIQRKYLKILD